MCTLDKLIEIKPGKIEKAPKAWGADTIVNAAHPTLRRGKGECVDYAIHKKIDMLNKEDGFFKKKIHEECFQKFNGNVPEIKCKRGDIFITQGYNLCKQIIHTVGPENDKYNKFPYVSSSSCINTLRSCYRKIVLEALENTDIHIIALPILSSGNYGFDFNQAFRIGLSEVYNVLLEQKNKDREFFKYSGIEKILFIIPDQENFKEAKRIYQRNVSVMKQEKRLVTFKTWESQAQYLKEVVMYDSRRGYFSIAKTLRGFLICFRFFSLYVYLKDLFGKWNWEKRRQAVEWTVIIKMLLPLVLLALLHAFTTNHALQNSAMFLMIYNLTDTITYLLALIFLADIQSPSANIIRALLMLLFNYLEVAFEITTIAYIQLKDTFALSDYICFGLLGTELITAADIIASPFLSGLNTGVHFFFVTMVFGYLTNHLRPRKFLTN